MKLACTLALLAFACAAAAQTQTPAPDAKQPAADAPPAKPRPALKLNLDELDKPSRPTVTFDQPDEKKKHQEKAGKDLPGLGGPMTRDWERPSSEIFPPDTEMPKMPGQQ